MGDAAAAKERAEEHGEGFLQRREDMTRWTAITEFQREATYLSESVTSNCKGKHLQTRCGRS